jgi:hypothetical protein
MSTGIRRPIYMSKKKDYDLINYFKNRKGYDFSHLARQLMRDGIKYQKLQRQEPPKENVLQMSHNVLQNPTPTQPVHASPQPQTVLKKKEVSSDDLEANLDKFL